MKNNLADIFGFTALDNTVRTVVPWLNFTSWGFYFWTFRASRQNLENLFSTISEFNLKYPDVQITRAGLKGEIEYICAKCEIFQKEKVNPQKL